ncbi:MAG TPA: pilin [Candidatus Paceibacterota bacterium]
MRSVIFLATFILIFVALTTPFSVQAVWVPDQPLIPCDGYTVKCDFDKLIVLANNIISMAIYLAILVAVAMFAFAGWLYLTSAGDTGKMKQAHTIFTNAAMGFVFVLTAWLIVTLILSALASKAFCESGAAKIVMSQAQIDKCKLEKK